MLHRLFCLTLLLPTLATAAEDNGPKPPPWHLIDIWWDIGQDPKLAEVVQDTVWKVVSTNELAGVKPPVNAIVPPPSKQLPGGGVRR